MWLPWRSDRKEIEKVREEARRKRGELTTKVVQLDEQRHMLDEMVRRSLALMEHKK